MSILPLVDLAAAYAEQQFEIEAAISNVCRSQRFIGGPEVSAFEEEFARYLGARWVVGVANGTSALELVIRALGIGAGDEVLLPANTFIATAEAIAAAGATPRLADVDWASGLIDLDSAAERIGPRTRAVIPVHLYGRMVDMDEVIRFAEKHDLLVIEDAAQAHGASRLNHLAGTLGVAGCFSFYPGKNLGAFGDAGAIATNDDTLAERLRLLRDHGRRGRHHHVLFGFNARLDALQAAILRVKLRRLNGWNQARRDSAERYRSALPPSILDWKAPCDEAEVHHLFPILVGQRDQLADHLREMGVETGVHYREALSKATPLSACQDDCPVAERRAAHQLSLPMHPHLTKENVDFISKAITDYLEPVDRSRR